MAVVIETTLGDITVDLYLEQRPVTCLNFLKLCKLKYYNFNLFHSIRSGFIAQTGDPTGEGSGGNSVFGLLEGPEKRFFSAEKMPKIRHSNAGLLSMVCTGDMMVGSQFFFTLAPDLDSLDGIHCVIGEVTEGHEVLRKLNEVICDETHRPYQDVRITHTVILEDPYNDPPEYHAPSRSPSPSAERLKGGRIAPDEELDETQGKSAAEIQEIIEEKEAKARATILEIVGDLPDADIAPPENVLFVCKLNPVTTDEDLEIIFSRFGKIVSCEVIRDKKTGDSLQYAFIEFDNKKSCEDAYFKMDNVLIDDRRIHVDFSQSVSKMRWLGKGRGVQHFDNDDHKNDFSKMSHVKNRNYDGRSQNNENERDRARNIRHSKDDYKDQDNGKNYQNKRLSENPRRSRSHDRLISKRDKSFERYSKNHRDRDYKHKSKYSNHDVPNRRHQSHDISRNKSNSSNARSPSRNERIHSIESNHKEKNNHSTDRKDTSKYLKLSKRDDSNRKSLNKQSLENFESSNHSKNLKRSKKEHHDPRTPSPTKQKVVSKKVKNKKPVLEKKKKVTKKTGKKRRRKHSTSSESDSSDSSLSSSSSSSDSDVKKRKKRRKKYSSSSSSVSSDSSSSSSSSDSSSDSSSSSSDSNKDKKRSKNKRVVKKTKKK